MLSSDTDSEVQFPAGVVDHISTLEQSFSHQNTASALCTLATQKAPSLLSSNPKDRPLYPNRVALVAMAPEVTNPTSGLLSLKRFGLESQLFGDKGEGERSLDHLVQDFFSMPQLESGAVTRMSVPNKGRHHIPYYLFTKTDVLELKRNAHV